MSNWQVVTNTTIEKKSKERINCHMVLLWNTVASIDKLFSFNKFSKILSYNRGTLRRQKKYGIKWTSLDWQKSAPYLRLKNSKTTSKCLVFLQYESWTKLVRPGPGSALNGVTLSDFLLSIEIKYHKIEDGTLWIKKIFREKSHNAEKTEREDPLWFFNIYAVAKHQKIGVWTLWQKKNLENF